MYLEIEAIEKSYGTGSGRTKVLDGVSAGVKEGSICVILGPSGSGKSTFLNAIGGLDLVDQGRISVNGQNIVGLNSVQTARYRRENIGFIFQFYNLIPNLTVRENIQVCEYLTKSPLDIDELIDTLGLTDHQNKFPSQLSGGQQQRCAIGRALVKNPKLLLCDEPTGALDFKTSKEILALLERVNQKYHTTMLIVTHNIAIKDMAHQVIRLKDGHIEEAYENTNLVPARELEW